jgi:hypothetical protein
MSPKAPSGARRLRIRTEDLWAALDCLAAAPKRARTVRVGFRDGELEFVRGVMAARVPASGAWDEGEAVVHADFVRLRLLRNTFPEEVVVQGTASTIDVGSTYSISCRWEAPETNRR